MFFVDVCKVAWDTSHVWTMGPPLPSQNVQRWKIKVATIPQTTGNMYKIVIQTCQSNPNWKVSKRANLIRIETYDSYFRYILKLPLLCAAQMSVIKSIFTSKIKLILSTRHPKPSFLSFAKIFAQNDINKVARFFYGNLSLPYDHTLKEPLYQTHYNNPNKVNVGQITSLGYASVIVGYLLNR